MTDKIIEEVMKFIPESAGVASTYFEGANIILYTTNTEFFTNHGQVIREVVSNIKKRVEVRCDPSIVLELEKAKKIIEEIVPKEAGLTEIISDPQRSIIIIEAEKPGLAIGKEGEILKEIAKKTYWSPLIRRTPPLRSTIIENIRKVLYENNTYRKKFLHKVGKRIYGGWTGEKRNEWIKLTCLGGGREVGRSCLFLQTPESNVLLDCGINVASDEHAFPSLDAPEFDLKKLDAVIISHPHLDHCLHPESYIQLGDGTISKISDFYDKKNEDIKCLDIDDSLSIENWKCFDKVKIPSPEKLYKIKTKSKEIIVTGEHPFFLLDDNLNIIHKKAKDLKEKEFIATAKRIPFKGKKQELKDIIKIIRIIEKGRKILKNERNRRGLKQKDVAKKINCTSTTIYSIEKEGTCSLNLFKKLIKFYEMDNKFINRYSKKKENKSTKVKFPKKTSKELLQGLGYLIGDGCGINFTSKGKRFTRIEMTDKNVSNLECYKKIFDNLFSLNGKIVIRDRNRLIYYSPLLLDFINEISNKILCRSPYREIPSIAHKTSKNELSGFLRGLYDAEGSIGDHHIILTSTSKNIIQITQMLLLRYDIHSHIYEAEGMKRKIYQLAIYNPKSIKFFKKKINFEDLNKKNKLEKLCKNIGNGIERINLIPINGNKIIEIANKLNLRKIDLENRRINWYHYFKHNVSVNKLKYIIKVFKKESKKKDINLKEIENLDKIINSDIFWDPIQSIDLIKSNCDFVYDLKVAGHHNYIANGIIVHNCGFIPYLNRYGYKGPIYCTSPTRDIGALLCLDLIGIAQKEGKKPVYTSADIKDMVKHTITLNFEEVTDIAPDMRLTLYNAGHNLGSSITHLHIGNGLHNLVYSGDYNYEISNLLPQAVTRFPRAETVITEATYGGKEDVFPTRNECEIELLKIIKETVAKRGKVLMPVLGVGRSQEILLIIEKAVREGLIEKLPVFIQGMVWDVTAIHTAYPEFLNPKIKKLIFHRDENPFLSDIFKRVASYKEMESVINEEGSCVIMATSGMMTGGPSVSYFKNLADNKNNSLVLTCYQGVGSLGRRLQDGHKEILLDGEKVEVKMPIHVIRGFSGHSNREQLINWACNLYPKPRKIIVNHGEFSKCLDLSSTLHKMQKIETCAPKNLETVRIR